MMIHSQNNKMFVNYDLIVAFEIKSNGDKWELVASDESLRDYVLGEYQTEKEAQSTMNEMVFSIETNKSGGTLKID